MKSRLVSPILHSVWWSCSLRDHPPPGVGLRPTALRLVPERNSFILLNKARGFSGQSSQAQWPFHFKIQEFNYLILFRDQEVSLKSYFVRQFLAPSYYTAQCYTSEQDGSAWYTVPFSPCEYSSTANLLECFLILFYHLSPTSKGELSWNLRFCFFLVSSHPLQKNPHPLSPIQIFTQTVKSATLEWLILCHSSQSINLFGTEEKMQWFEGKGEVQFSCEW